MAYADKINPVAGARRSFTGLVTVFTWVVFGLGLWVIGPTHAQTDGTLPTVEPSHSAFFTDVFEGYVDRADMAGSAFIVLHRGEVVYHRAFGWRDREQSIPMTTDTIFRIASQTKALISVGIMMLQEEGRLLVSDPVGHYLPEWRETTVAEPDSAGGYRVVPASRPITIRDLLTHTAGVGYGYGRAQEAWRAADLQGWYFAHRSEPIQASIARMATLPMDAHPGTRFVYGYNTDILGALIEVVSGQPLDVFIASRITGPLGMVDTHFYLPPEKADRLATNYGWTEEAGLFRAPDEGTTTAQGHYVEGPRVSFSGGAGLVSTTSDYARFLEMLRRGGTLDGVRLLSPKSVQAMTSDQMNDVDYNDRAGKGFGYGFSIREIFGRNGELGSVGEFGWGGAYGSTYWVDPAEELVVVYFKQLTPRGPLDDQAKLRALIYGALN